MPTLVYIRILQFCLVFDRVVDIVRIKDVLPGTSKKSPMLKFGILPVPVPCE